MRLVRYPDEAPPPARPRRAGGGLDDARRQQLAECVVAVRCPVCRHVLVACITRRGPCFVCACPGHGVPAA
jgi:hypothetical protein